MNTAIDISWKSKGICLDAGDEFFADMDDVTTFVDLGLTPTEAEAHVAQLTADAKRACQHCPVRAECFDAAMINDEEFGIWGGLDPKERHARREGWLQGRGTAVVEPTVQKDFDLLRQNAGVSSKLQARNEFARIARDKLLQMPREWSTERTRKEPPVTRDEFLHVCELILANPTLSAGEIVGRQGLRGEWLTFRVRKLRAALQID